jgi:poly-gamma-glutamate capsule biosynthesis protein CapA/YwtB (metallophosphatase superfamily)
LRISDCGLRIFGLQNPQSNPQSAIRNPQCIVPRGGFMRRAPLVGSLLVLGCAVIVAQQSPAPAPRDPQRELAMSVADGFTMAAVGDCIIARPVSQTPGFAAVGRILRDADSAFGNFEGTAIDLSRTPAVPQAEFGGVWIIGAPAVAKDLKAIGFDIMSRANNHATDWGLEGMRQTTRALDEAGIVHAGVGEHRAAARAARFFDTDKGRVGLISLASTFTPLSRSAPPVGEAPGRPGVNALRTTRYSLVTAEELRALRKIRDEQPAGSVRVAEKEPADELDLFGVRYKVADRRGFTYTIDPVDEREVLKSIRAAKQLSDFVVVTIHAHEPGNWSQEPADFLPKLARAAIDAGADQFIGHGPHQIRGIEVYRGKPIFYSLGDFIFQLDLLEPVGSDLYEQYKMDAGTTTDAEFNAMWNRLVFGGDIWYQSVVTTSRFEKGQLAEIRLHPVDLSYAARGADRGVPRLASAEVGKTILERMQRLSQPFGTRIAIEGGVGIIRLSAPATAARH